MIEGEDKIVDAFGYFPTFHDGEILDLHLARNSTPESDYPTVSITFTLHATVLKPKANIQDEDAAPRREDAVVEARFLGVEK